MESLWNVYLLRCRDGSLYCGIAKNLVRRIKMHESSKGSKYVRSRLPVRLVWFKYVENKSAALKEEARIKRLGKVRKLRMVAR